MEKGALSVDDTASVGEQACSAICLGGFLGFSLRGHCSSSLRDSSMPWACDSKKEGEADPALWTSH